MVDIEEDKQKGKLFAIEMNAVFPFGSPPKEVSEALADHLLRPHAPPETRADTSIQGQS